MSNKTIVGLCVALVLGVLTFFVYLYQKSQKKIDWSETYKETPGKKEYRPYDLSLLRDCLNGNDFQTKDVKENIKTTLKGDLKNTSYVFVGEGLRADSSDFYAMASYISNGNDVFISSKYVANQLLKHFLKDDVLREEIVIQSEEEEAKDDEEDVEAIVDEQAVVKENDNEIVAEIPDVDSYTKRSIELDVFEDSLVNVSLLSPENYTFKTGYFSYFNITKGTTSWYFFDEKVFDTNKFKQKVSKIGDINKRTNCICINYGNGNLFLHCTPILFTNIELMQPTTKDYTIKLLSLLKKGDIFWDNHNRVTRSEAKEIDEQTSSNSGGGGGRRSKQEKTPLQYILSNPSLAWAWYSLLAMGVLFLIFTSKRRQRIVPVLAQNTNTSLAFIQTIGRMYFNKQDHTSLARLQFKQWQWFIRERYQLNTNKLDEDFEKRVFQKSGIKQNDIHRLLESGKYVDGFGIIENDLIDFHKELEFFYKNCK
jgi:hypothetical protein